MSFGPAGTELRLAARAAGLGACVQAAPRARGGRVRRGMTLLEVLVAIAIVLVVIALSVPAMNAIFSLDQRQAARELAMIYERLHDEAVLRNVTFRVAYHLDEGFYEVEVGDPDVLIFGDPEARARHEVEQREKLERFSEEERAAHARSEVRFETVTTFHKRRIELPGRTVFGGVYTPQYGEMVRPSGARDPEDYVVVHSYLFPSGFSEPTVVQFVWDNDPRDGFTVSVEPLTGRVDLRAEVLDQHDVFRDVPRQGPDLP